VCSYDLVALNLGADPAALDFPPEMPAGRLILSSHCDRDIDTVSGNLALRPNEGVIVELA